MQQTICKKLYLSFVWMRDRYLLDTSFFIMSLANHNSLALNYAFLSNMHKIRSLSTSDQVQLPLSKNIKLDPWWVTGFIDGEGSFIISIVKNKLRKIGWEVQLLFSINLHVKDISILEEIKKFYGVGSITKHGPNSVRFRVQSNEAFLIIISHLDKFPLLTNKNSNLKLFNLVLKLKLNKEHLTEEGLKKIIPIRKANNQETILPELEKAFPDITRVERPGVKNHKGIIDPNWIAGFTAAEGCFQVSIFKSPESKTGSSVKLVFTIGQHSRNEKLMQSLIEYFNCGQVYKNGNMLEYKVSKLADIVNFIIPFFERYKLFDVKVQDFHDFCKIASIMKNKKHLTEEGLQQIRKIKAGMNRGRNHNNSNDQGTNSDEPFWSKP